ncbi:hypothetical protein LA52FAK_22960 [Desulforhopalus sp. 52FAK]
MVSAARDENGAIGSITKVIKIVDNMVFVKKHDVLRLRMTVSLLKNGQNNTKIGVAVIYTQLF